MGLICRKCDSSDVEVYIEKTTSWSTNPARVFHCRGCGKLLYGDLADREIEYQRLNPVRAPREPAQAPAPLVDVHAYNRKMKALQISTLLSQLEALLPILERYRSSLDEKRGFKSEEFECLFNLANVEVSRTKYLIGVAKGQSPSLEVLQRAWKEISPTRLEEQYQRALKIHRDQENGPVILITCKWMDCENLPSMNSMYCSPSCRNKNAHWRELERKKSLKA